MNKILQIPGFISKVTTRADRSLKIQFDTQELPPETSALVFSYYQKFGSFAFAEGKGLIHDINVPEYLPVEKGDKTPSKRLRDVFFVLWKQKDEPGGDFDDYYKKQYELLINHFKSKLDEI